MAAKKKTSKKRSKKAAATRKKTASKKTAARKKVAAKKKTTARKTSKKKAAKKKVAKKKVAKKAAKKKQVSKKKAAAKKKVAKKKVSKKKVSKKKAAKKKAAKKAAKKSPSTRAASKKKVSKKKTTTKKVAKKATKKVAKKAVTKKATAKKAAAKPAAKQTAAEKKAAAATKRAPERKAIPTKRRRDMAQGPIRPPIPKTRKPAKSALSGPIHGIEPYKPKRGEEYMSDEQLEHFREILLAWKRELMQEVDRTLVHMQDEAANFPDPNDRATQESEFGLELRTRDRERKLLRKIDQALGRIDDGTYGYCDATGEEIGLKRLEARPVATMSLEAQERREMAERQFRDRDDRYR